MPDFLEQKRNEISAQLTKLEPAVKEYELLQAAASALAAIPDSPTATTNNSAPATAPRAATTPRRQRRRARKNSSPATTTTTAAPAKTTTGKRSRRAGRPKGSGGRSAQALKHVTEQPGITIPELASKMGVKTTYLYRVLPPLKKEGKVTQQGRAWHPKS